MPSASVKNPNCVSRNRQRALRAKARKQTLQAAASARLPDRVARADVKRGARTGLLPTSGPNKPLSSKKARKLEKQMAHAIRRKREEEDKKSQIEMQGEPSSGAVAPRHQVKDRACADWYPLADAEDKSSKKQLKTERNETMQALEKMDIS